MKLRQITENDEYAGLEDADEFGEESLGPCTQCNRGVLVDTGGVWKCEHGDAVAHFSCAMPSQQDLKDYENKNAGVLSSGWYFERQAGPFQRNWNVLNGTRVSAAARAYDKYLCPTCAQAYLTEDIDEYAGLEDADEFEGDSDYYSASQDMHIIGQSLADDLNSTQRRPEEFEESDEYNGAIWSEEDNNFDYWHAEWDEFMGRVYFDTKGRWNYDWQAHA